jgi:cysteine desulfurase/selenocysteine lyase
MLTAATRQADFPSLTDMAYFNSAAEGIPPVAVADALAQYAADRQLGMDGRSLHEAQWHAARRQAARAYGLTEDEIGICSCSSEAYNLACMALQHQPGDEVVISDLEFPASATPWLRASCPAKTRLWRARQGALRVEDLIPLLSTRTRLVSLSLVSFYNGHLIRLPQIVEAIRRHSSALLAVDVTQALGRIRLELDGVDLVVSSTHKWILASHGGCLVGVPAARAEQWTVPAGGWFNIANAFDEDRFEQVVTKPGAASFSVGMPNYPASYAINAGLGYVQSVGIDAIDAYARPLIMACLEQIQKLPVELLTPPSPPPEPEHIAGIIAFKHPKAERIHRRLLDENIHVMHHAGRLRIAVHGYNTADEVELLLKTLTEALQDV